MTDTTKRCLTPLTKFPEKHGYPPIGTLRHLVFHAESNGFDKVIRRVGRRILIDDLLYFEWLDKRNGITGNGSDRDVTSKEQINTITPQKAPECGSKGGSAKLDKK